ncbi:ribonuclease III [Flavipsychrobacter stenotrophus]|uniref:Ribonuclease 3 n=1 Tax=Flavipsychrobacter stenotrophus TaxID=2077091 RepID=A0A2S7SYY1_9BACT|nr:ribonuclease III [Flavipsychrobacter stenotrophus]
MLNIFSSDKELLAQLEQVLGFTPKRVAFYKLALMHRSRPEEATDSNERLEFLGDAFLGAIIAEYLFKKYPYEDEGYLTELRSKIVRRETMNNVALRMGLNKLVVYNTNDRSLSRSHIFGNALEALIGAVYLDRGLEVTRKFIINQLVRPYVDLDTMESTDTNFKNQLLSWAQKNNHTLSFDTLDEKIENTRKLFTVGITVNGEMIASGTGYNKKDAGQVAAKNALEKLGPIGER